MPSLVNENKLILCSAAFFLSAMSARALELRLNGSSSFDIIGAGHVEVLSGETLLSKPYSEKVQVILNADSKAETQTEIKIKLKPYEAIELFWNDLPVELGKSDSQWQFFHGSCDKTEKLFIERQPDDSISVAPDNPCKSYRDSGDRIATKLIIQKQLPLGTLPNQHDSVYFSPDVLNEPFNLPFLDLGITMTGKTGSGLFTHQKLAFGSQKHSLIAEQQAFLADPASYSPGEITVFIGHRAIAGQLLADVPTGSILNTLVESSDSAEDLLNLIIQAMRELDYIRPEEGNYTPVTVADFLAQVTKVKGPDDDDVEVWKVRCFIKHHLRKNHPDKGAFGRKGGINLFIEDIIHRMQKIKDRMINDGNGQSGSAEGQTGSGDEPVAGATGFSRLTSDQRSVIRRLAANHDYKSHALLRTLGRLVQNQGITDSEFDEIKEKVKGDNGSINLSGLRELMRTSDRFEKLLKAADSKSCSAKKVSSGQNSISTKPGPKNPKNPKGPKGPRNGKRPAR